MSPPSRIAWLLVPVLLLSCSDAGLYALDGQGPSGRDRADFAGSVCVPLAGGEAFPVKVLFAVQGGTGIPANMPGAVTDALGTLASRFSGPSTRFSLLAFHTVATGLLGRFDDASAFQAAVSRYATYQESGPTSHRSALRLARSILSGDMQTGCAGEVARTRYLVVLVVTSPDQSCEYPAFNAGLDSRCTKLSTPSQCSQCELGVVAGELQALVQRFGAGEVTVQPVYVRDGDNDDLTLAQVGAIANAGGTQPVVTDFANLRAVLGGLNYASLQSHLGMKRFLAFNRNVVVRAGEVLADSDGDGVADRDELALGLDPTLPDSDGDGLMDGIELRMGLNPAPGHVDIIPGCNLALDDDGDRLNTCEERVLGTDPCVGDTDGDGLPDLVEALVGTNPLLPEDLRDSDRDGLTNLAEVEARGDPLSADLAFHTERGYRYSLEDAEPTVDGRACYAVRARNITVVPTLERPHPVFPGRTIPAGTNDIYLYMQVGRDNDPRGNGIGALRIESLRYTEKEGRTPAGLLPFTPEEFILGT